jgi:hypothetical protein
MRKRFGQRMERGNGGAQVSDLTPSSSTRVRGGNLTIEIAQWVVTTITLGQAVWRWLRRPKDSTPQPPAASGQGNPA